MAVQLSTVKFDEPWDGSSQRDFNCLGVGREGTALMLQLLKEWIKLTAVLEPRCYVVSSFYMKTMGRALY